MAINFYPLRTSDNYIYINILLSRLKEEGFDCHLKDENTVTVDPLLSNAIGGIKLMVREEDVDRANMALDRIEAEYVATLTCPRCGRQTIQRIKKVSASKGFFGTLWLQLTMGGTHFETKSYRCTECGYRSEEMPSG